MPPLRSSPRSKASSGSATARNCSITRFRGRGQSNEFRDSQLAERILKLLAETNFPANRLEVEIRESSVLEDRESAPVIVESLKNMGVTISLDDFGTGYASLSQLQSLPFDRIKIDKSFVSSLLVDAQSDATVSTIPVTRAGASAADYRRGHRGRRYQGSPAKAGMFRWAGLVVR